MEWLYHSIYFLALIPGIIFVFVPGLPAIGYFFVVSFLYSLTPPGSTITGSNLLVLLLITVLSVLVDLLAGTFGARYSGASMKSLFVGITAFVLVSLMLSPLAGIFALFVAIVCMEYYRGKNKRDSINAAVGGVLGVVAGILINISLALLFISFAIVFVLS